jgi:hypothetical protein
MARELGASMKLQLAGMRLETLGPMGPRRRLRQCSRGELGTQRGPGDQGNEQAQRGDDCDGRLPSSSRTSTPKIHGGATVQDETWAAPPASCENDQSPVCVAADGLLAGLRRTARTRPPKKRSGVRFPQAAQFCLRGPSRSASTLDRYTSSASIAAARAAPSVSTGRKWVWVPSSSTIAAASRSGSQASA